MGGTRKWAPPPREGSHLILGSFIVAAYGNTWQVGPSVSGPLG